MKGAPVERLDVHAFTVPTDAPESDGTFEWDSTTIVVVHVHAAGKVGLGYTYGDASVADLINHTLAHAITAQDAFETGAAWVRMVRAVRNVGRPGLASMAISAVDVALWDLKARLLDIPLACLFGVVRREVPLYGSGGFTSYSNERLCEQLAGWVSSGFTRVKMKVGRDLRADATRIEAAREAIGPEAELFIDANGALSRAPALRFAEDAAQMGVSWFEEPVSSDDLEGLRWLRDRAPAGMAIAAGEYGYDLPYFQRMLDAGAVHVLQADATRCGGLTGFFGVAPLCEARSLLLSAHTAPSLHVHACCAVRPFAHLEYFHDHVRVEHLLFDGAADAKDGVLRPDLSRPGLGLELKNRDADRYRV